MKKSTSKKEKDKKEDMKAPGKVEEKSVSKEEEKTWHKKEEKDQEKDEGVILKWGLRKWTWVVRMLKL